MELIHPRSCGIDVHKESVVVCLRLQQGRRAKTEVRRFGTTTAELLRLHEWLSQAGCTHVAMESTSVYWKPVFNLLEGSFEVVLANAFHIKAVPGRKTDAKDCEWIADLLAHGLIRASFIPPLPIRELRDLTRHRKSLVRDRVKATNRVHKLLETAKIKLANVISDVLGVSGRAMSDALAAGETYAEHLAKLARGSLIPKVRPLAEALRGPLYLPSCLLAGTDAHTTRPTGGADCAMRCSHPRGREAVRTGDPASANDRRCGTALGGGVGVRDRCGYVAVLDRWSSGFVGSHLSGQQAPERQHGHGKQLAANRASEMRRSRIIRGSISDRILTGARRLPDGLSQPESSGERLACFRLPANTRNWHMTFAAELRSVFESAFSIVETVCRNVKRWRAGDHIERWVGSGLLVAERQFRKVQGYREIPSLLTALANMVSKKAVAEEVKVA